MFNVRVKYATCPYCKVELNLMDYIPVSAISKSSDNGTFTTCPNHKCKKQIIVFIKTVMEITAEKYNAEDWMSPGEKKALETKRERQRDIDDLRAEYDRQDNNSVKQNQLTKSITKLQKEFKKDFGEDY